MSDRRTAEVLIYNGTDLARITELRQAAEVAERIATLRKEAGTGRMGDDESPQAAKDAYDAFVAEAAERAEVVRIQALGRKVWRSLLEAHPPRMTRRMIDGAENDVIHDDDEGYNVNTATLSEALLTYSEGNGEDLEQTIMEPEFPSKEARLKWLDNLAGGDFDKLFLTAWGLNGNIGFDPKLTRYSTGSPISPEISE